MPTFSTLATALQGGLPPPVPIGPPQAVKGGTTGGGSLTPFQQASSLLSQYGTDPGNYNPQTADPIRDQLIQQGYLDWGSDAQGNKQLIGGGVMQDAINAATAKLTPGSDTSIFEAVNPLNLVSRLPTATGALAERGTGPIMSALGKYLSGALSTGNVQSYNPGISGHTVGEIDPTTGLQTFQTTGAKPQLQMGLSMDALIYQLAPMLMLSPIAGPLMAGMAGDLGALGSGLFKFLGSELLNSGNSSKPGGVNIAQLLPLLFGRGG